MNHDTRRSHDHGPQPEELPRAGCLGSRPRWPPPVRAVPGLGTLGGAGRRTRSAPLVSPRLALGSDQYHRDRPDELRHRVVAALLAGDTGPGGDPQRRRDRGLLPQQVPAPPSSGGPGRPGPLRRAGPGGPRGRPVRLRPHGLQPHPRGLLPSPPRLVRRRPRGPALSRGRAVRHVHQQPLLRRVHPRRLARDHRAIASRGDHRQ